MTATTKITLSPAQEIPFNKLVLSQSNVRKTKAGVSIDALAESISRRSLLQSLTVRPVVDDEGQPTGTYEVPAGGRRFRALELLVRQKRLAKTAPVPCIVKTTGTAEDDSLAENVDREPLHPLDQFRAFQTLHDERGQGIEEIAAAFAVTPAVVRQRLKLASASPRLLDLYAEDQLTLDQLIAFCISDDHARQEQVWEALNQYGSTREPYAIRRMLTEGAVRATDKRVKLVGADAYEAAGGVILRDLFTEGDEGLYQEAAILDQLARQMARDEVRSASVAWATVEELPAELRPKAVEQPRREMPKPDGGPERERTLGAVDARRQASGQSDWLIAPRVSADGRDSLGRGLDQRGVMAAVSADPDVRRERQGQGVYLQTAYKDPQGAKKRLDGLVARDGHVSASQRLSADPGQLGELRGKTGMLAGAVARQERANAVRSAEAVGPSVARVGEAELGAERAYRAGVGEQLTADRTGVPRLSERAQAGLAGVKTAKDDHGRAEAWKALLANEPVARELASFKAATEQRFGGEGVRSMLRAEQPGAKPFEGGTTVGPEQRRAVAQVGQALSTMRAGQGATVAEAQKLAQVQRVSLGARMKP